MTGISKEHATAVRQTLGASGATAARVRATDWDRTALGPLPEWPTHLLTSVRLALDTPMPMIVLWSEECHAFFNDAAADTLFLEVAPGQSLGKGWPEGLETLAPVVERVRREGRGTSLEDRRYVLQHDGRPEERFLTFVLTPLRDLIGNTHGVLAFTEDTTQRVLLNRRRRTVAELAERMADGPTVVDVYERAAAALGDAKADIPFAALYRLHDDEQAARLVASTPDVAVAVPTVVDLDVPPEAESPVAVVIRTRTKLLLEEGWPSSSGAPRTTGACFLPITDLIDPDRIYGVWVAGLSPHRSLDEPYEDFLDRLSERISHAVSAATARQAAVVERANADRFERLADATSRFHAVTTTESMAAVVAECARGLVGATHALTAVVVDGRAGEAVAAVSPSGESESGRVIPVAARDIDTLVGLPLRVATHSTMPAPLRTFLDAIELQIPPGDCLATSLEDWDGRPIGILVLTHCRRDAFGEDEQWFTTQFAAAAGNAFARALMSDGIRRALSARDDVLSIVSHDLRNPLNTISLGLEVMMRVELDAEQRRAKLGTIQGSVAHANRLIDDLLDAARIDAGTFDVEPTAVSVAVLLNEASALMRPLADAKRLVLECAPEPDLPLVRADGQRVIQVLQNLISNAIQVMSSGTIAVTAKRDEATRPGVRVDVRDEGPGIAPGDRDRLFQRYWRGDRSRRKGAGLGLAIAKGIVEKHGGRIWVESTVGEGSTFCFTLPFDDSQA